MDKKVTYAEAILVEAIKDSIQAAATRVLAAGNRSGGVAVAAMRRWPEAVVVAHAFDYHHARAIRKRLLDEGLPARNVRCAAGVGVEDGAYDLAFFMTTPQSMPAELALDQIQDIHANLSDGGTLYAAYPVAEVLKKAGIETTTAKAISYKDGYIFDYDIDTFMKVYFCLDTKNKNDAFTCGKAQVRDQLCKAAGQYGGHARRLFRARSLQGGGHGGSQGL